MIQNKYLFIYVSLYSIVPVFSTHQIGPKPLPTSLHKNYSDKIIFPQFHVGWEHCPSTGK